MGHYEAALADLSVESEASDCPPEVLLLASHEVFQRVGAPKEKCLTPKLVICRSLVWRFWQVHMGEDALCI